jgi:hypothetical protein
LSASPKTRRRKAMNAPYHPIETAADVLAMLEHADLLPVRKRDLISAVRLGGFRVSCGIRFNADTDSTARGTAIR